MFHLADTATSGLLRALQATQHRLERTAVRLATGRRLATASDDPAGVGVARRLDAGVVSAAAAESNYAAGQDMARTAEGALQATHDTLLRMRELSVEARTGTLSAADRATLQQEYSELASSLDQIAPGSGTTTVTDGEGGGIDVPVTAAGAVALGVAGTDVAAPGTLGAIDGAIDAVAGARAVLGAADARLDHHRGIVEELQAQLAEMRSRLVDTDLASGVAELQQSRLLHGMQIAGLRAALDLGRARIDVSG